MKPISTYRLQLHAGFRFTDAEKCLAYLSALGVSDVYSSPILHAEKGSSHGYNVVDPQHLNPELGSDQDFIALTDAMKSRELGHVFDMVPNHMGIAPEQNAWWADVLEHGEGSRYAPFFDIDWAPRKKSLHHRILLPILGDQYGIVLERGELRIVSEGDRLRLAYYDTRLPLAPESVSEGLDEPHALRALNGTVGDAASFDALDALLNRQHYRLAYWRVATEQINYRRFFDVNQLAAIRVEEPQVFDAVHSLLLRLVREGRVTGIRLDHTDGLFYPAQYLEALRERAGDVYVVAEKILEPGEALPRWPLQGTTGYDFIRYCSGLFQDPAGEAPLTRIYEKFVGSSERFTDIVHRAKQTIMRTSLASEITMLAQMLERLAESDRRSRDFTLMTLRHAIVETMAAFPVYRTYVRPDGGREADDDAQIIQATALAERRNPQSDATVFGFVRDVLMLRTPSAAHVEFAMKFQQVSSPVMAKSVEDTAFFLYTRWVAHNEVGCDPSLWGVSEENFHTHNKKQRAQWPETMLASSTHDTKRGEDVRARLSVLTSAASEWATWVDKLSTLAAPYRTEIQGAFAPSRIDEYHFYQCVLGAFAWNDDADSLSERLVAYMSKASKEAKADTSWLQPNAAYDGALERFVQGTLGDETFFSLLTQMRAHIAKAAAVNALSQVALKMISPGVVDTYQGSELWNFSLVDPDNRRPVDYAAREALLARVSTARDRLALSRELLAAHEDGGVKLLLTWVCLHHRRRAPELFRSGEYEALRAPEDVVAVVRMLGAERAICIAPRLAYRRAGRDWPLAKIWKDESVLLPEGEYINLLTGEAVDGGEQLLSVVLRDLPVAWISSR